MKQIPLLKLQINNNLLVASNMYKIIKQVINR